MKIYPFEIFDKMLEIDFKNLTKHDWDNLVVLCGHEGTGKSLLSLYAIEKWLKLREEPIIPDKLNHHMGVKLETWTNILRIIGQEKEHGRINVLDEAGDILSGKHSSNRIVTGVEDSLKVIRGLNLFTILVSPDFFVLSPYIRKWRVRSVWYVSSRGVCNVYYGKTLKILISKNENAFFRDMFVVQPNFSFKVPLYKGVYLKEYKKMKHDKMYDVLQNLNDIVIKEKSKK